MGNIQIKLNNGNECILKDVGNIHAMKIILISTWQLGDSDCLYMFGKTWWKITKGAPVITKGDRIGMLNLCPCNTNYCIFIYST